VSENDIIILWILQKLRQRVTARNAWRGKPWGLRKQTV